MFLREFWKLSPGVRDSLVMTGGTSGATLVSALAGILISRMLGPMGFGEFSVGLALAFILGKVNDLGLMAAQLKYVPTRKSESEKQALFNYVLKVKLVIAMAIWWGGWLIAPLIIAGLKFTNPAIIYLSFLLNAITVLFEQLIVMLQSLKRVRETVTAAFTQALTKLAATLLLMTTPTVSPVSALFAYLSAPVLTLLGYKKLMPFWFKIKHDQLGKGEQKLFWSMAGHSLVFYISLGLVDNLDVLLVEGFMEPYETGLYSAASRLALFLSMVAYSLGAVLYPRVAGYTKLIELKGYWNKAIKGAGGAMLAGLLLLPLAQVMLLVTVGRQYLAASLTLQVLIVASIFTVVTVFFTAFFFRLTKADWYFSTFGVLHLVLLVIAGIILIPKWGAEGAALSKLITKGIMLVYTVGMAGWQLKKLKALDE